MAKKGSIIYRVDGKVFPSTLFCVFKNTEVRWYDASFSFIFSPRPGTPAANLHDDTPHEIKLKRLQHLQDVLDENVRHISASRQGTVQRILVEGPSRKNPAELMGRTECNRIVNFNGGPNSQRLIGQMIDVTITEALPHSLRGKVLVAE